jgi:hypothetical protein
MIYAILKSNAVIVLITKRSALRHTLITMEREGIGQNTTLNEKFVSIGGWHWRNVLVGSDIF